MPQILQFQCISTFARKWCSCAAGEQLPVKFWSPWSLENVWMTIVVCSQTPTVKSHSYKISIDTPLNSWLITDNHLANSLSLMLSEYFCYQSDKKKINYIYCAYGYFSPVMTHCIRDALNVGILWHSLWHSQRECAIFFYNILKYSYKLLMYMYCKTINNYCWKFQTFLFYFFNSEIYI